jgi:multidrug resistance efflux pump
MNNQFRSLRLIAVGLFAAVLVVALLLSRTHVPEVGDGVEGRQTVSDVDNGVTSQPETHSSFRLEVVAFPSVSVESSVSGSVALDVSEGDRVDLDGLLASVGIGEWEARLARAQAQHGVARHQVRTLRHLVAEGYEPQVNLDRAQARLDTASSDLAEAQAALEAGRIRAPAAGIVHRLLVEEGMSIEAGDVIALLVLPGPRHVRSRVPTDVVARLTPGQRASVVIGADTFDAQVVTLLQDGDETEIRLEIPKDIDLPFDGAVGRLFLPAKR